MSTLLRKTRNFQTRDRIKTEDGHLVRSRGETLIANGLYYRKIRYAYEKTIWYDEKKYLIPDFYLPDIGLYIEYWGLNDDEYNNRRKDKEKKYRELGLNLFSIENKHLNDLDRRLNKLMLYQNSINQKFYNIGTISLAELKFLKGDESICLEGETIIGTVISNPFKGVTTMQNSYIQFDILDRGNTAVIRVYGNKKTENLDLASAFSVNQKITLQNPILPPKNYTSADIWINENKSYIFPFS